MEADRLIQWIRGGPDPYTEEERAKLPPHQQVMEALVDDLLTAAAAADAEPTASVAWQRARACSGDERVAIVETLAARACANQLRGGWGLEGAAHLNRLAAELLGDHASLSEPAVRSLVRLVRPMIVAACRSWPRPYGLLPIDVTLSFVQKRAKAGRSLEGIRGELDAIRKLFRRGSTNAYERKWAERIDVLLGEEILLEPGLAWTDAALADLDALPPEERAAWWALLRHAHALKTNAPSARWRTTALRLVDAIGAEPCRERVERWLALVALLPSVPEGAFGPSHLIPERSADTLRGLVFVLAVMAVETAPLAVGDLAERCLKKIPGVGPLSGKVGNACVNALGAMTGRAAIAQLERLRRSVKYAAAKRLLENALNAAAAREGLSRADLEELSVPTFDLGLDGLTRELPGATARLRISGTREVTLEWTDERGRVRKAPPAAAQEAANGEVAALKRLAREIKAVLPGQVARIERLMLEGRTWAFGDWRARYLDHPLLAGLVRRLVWRVEDSARTCLGVPVDGELVDVEGRPLSPTSAARVALWHPLGAAPALVAAWRERLHVLGITQPWKQVHREVYVLTDAERETRDYSNRFAAHILRQHQFAALCRQQGWSYQLQGQGYDGANTPTLELPAAGLRAQLDVDTVDGADDEVAPSGVNLYVVTGAVRLYELGGRVRPLADIPPLLYSEILRDVDLFVGVASIGTDPHWHDRAAHAGYWERAAFGELAASAETRKAALERLVPTLEIAERASFEDRFLVVRGDLNTYKIHLGSGNVLMEPGGRFLCIVPRHASGAASIALPFEGDALLSEILSKAFLLARDGAITDEAIRSQMATPA